MIIKPKVSLKSNVIKELWRKKKFIPILLALSFMVLSIIIMIAPNPQIGFMFYRPNFPVDLTKIRWLVGPGLFFLSLYFIAKVIRSDYEITHCKCVNCGEIIITDISKKPKCSVCKGKLERLKGFFERHPEFDREKADKGKDMK